VSIEVNVLILGSTGLIGSAVCLALSSDSRFVVFGSARCDDTPSALRSLTGLTTIYADAENFGSIERAIKQVRPQAVINCIGITKHIEKSGDLRLMYELNAVFPHRLSALCEMHGSKLVHISSDCVFSGKSGGYLEEDFADANDHYGQSKALGELVNDRDLTIRTSTIGHEFSSRYGLLEWFLSQEIQCLGYTMARFSGLTALELGKVLGSLLLRKDKPLIGLFQLSGDAISKFDLLELIRIRYKHDIHVWPDKKVLIDRTLNGGRLDALIDRTPATWSEMLDELFNVKSFWGSYDKQ
jgi:dTDP-4-dehydrorhamnose reductase